jgi:uncharacterized protein (DUF885 family)
MSGVDTRLLLRGLEDYRKALDRYLKKMNTEFNVMEQRWRALNAVYTGDAADEFRKHWSVTAARFKEYLTRSQRIASMLDERIESLREYNRREGL